jgi:hypothetical protein
LDEEALDEAETTDVPPELAQQIAFTSPRGPPPNLPI